MPGQKITLSPRGLFTNVNSLGKIPEGGLLRADNTVITRPGVIESRRGSDPVYFGEKALRIFNAKLRVGGTAANGWLGTATAGMIVILAGTDNVLWTEDGETFTKVSPVKGQSSFPFYPVAGDRHYYAFEQNGIIYISTGVKKVDGSAVMGGIVAIGRPLPNSPTDNDDTAHAGYYLAGVPFGLNAQATVLDNSFGQDPGTALEADRQVAYRITFGYRDSSGIPHLGAPTTRAVAINPIEVGEIGSPKNVKIKTTIPPGIIASRNFWQVYRSLPSPSADVDPGDDEGLIYEGAIPDANTIVSAERTENVVTATTGTDHGYIVGQEFNLTVAIPGTGTTAHKYVMAIAAPAGDATRTVWKKDAYTGAWATTTHTFELEEVSGTVKHDGTKVCLLLAQDNSNKYIFYIENYSPWVYILKQTGEYVDKIKLSCLPDNAVYDPDTRTIHILGRPIDSSADDFNYIGTETYTQVKYVQVSTKEGIVAFKGSPARMATPIQTPWKSPAPVDVPLPAYQVSNGHLGIWRARQGSEPWLVMACAYDGRKPLVIASAYPTKSWKQFEDVGPNFSAGTDPDVSWNVYGTYYYRIFPGDTFKITTGDYQGETQTAFVLTGIATAPTTPVAPETVGPVIDPDKLISYLCHVNGGIYQMANNGNDEPGIYRMTVTGQEIKLATETDITYYNLPGPQAIKMRSDGNGIIIVNNRLGEKWYEEGTASDTIAPFYLWKFQDSFINATKLTPSATLFANYRLTGEASTTFHSGPVIIGHMEFNAATGDQTITTISAGPPLRQSESPIVATTPAYEYVDAVDTVSPDCNNLINSSFIVFTVEATPGGVPTGTYTVTALTTDPNVFKFECNGSNFTTYTPGTPIPIMVTSVSMIDKIAPDFIGPMLYTSPSQEGSEASNFPPPVSEDIALFRTYGFFANCTQPAAVQVTMLDVAIVNGTKIKLAGSAYATAGEEENLLTKTFKVYRGHLDTFPTTSLSDDIKSTIESLANVVNANFADFKNVIIPVGTGPVNFASFFVRAVDATTNAEFSYVSAGNVLIEGNFAPSSIIVAPESSGNVLYYSKTNIPDAVPLLNSIRIGADSKPIRRIVPARDCLFIFKDDGCFILRGYGPPWQVDPFDLTLQVACRDSLITLDNAVYGLFTRGCFKVSDANVELLSLPIQDQLERYIAGDNKDVGDELGFGLGDNPDHKYILWLPDLDSGEDNAEVAFVYDTFTESWNKWLGNYSHAISYKDSRLVYGRNIRIGAQQQECVAMEERSLTRADLNDGRRFHTANIATGADITVKTVNVASRQIALNTLFVLAGDVVKITYSKTIGGHVTYLTYEAVVMGDAAAGSLFTVSAEIPPELAVGDTANVYEGISQVVQFAPTFPTSPAASNHFSEYALSFRRAFWGDFLLTIERPIEESDQVDSVGEIPFDGVQHFGVQTTTEDRIAERNFLRTYVPRDQQRATLIIPGYTCRIANFPCAVDGIYVVMTPGPTSFTRR